MGSGNVNRVLVSASSTPFSTVEAINGISSINLKERHELKHKLVDALRLDWLKQLDSGCIDLRVADGRIQLVVKNEGFKPGFFTVEVEVKVKNLDFDPYDEQP